MALNRILCAGPSPRERNPGAPGVSCNVTHPSYPRPALVAALCCVGCTTDNLDSDGPSAPPDLDITLSTAIPTVATVSWHSDLSDAFIELSPTGESWRRIAADPRTDGSWMAMVVGMRPMTTYKLRVGGTQGSEEIISESVEITSGAAPPSLPELITLQDDVTDDAGLLGLGLISTTNWGVFLDADGYIDWWFPNPYEDRLTTRVLPSRDRRSVFVSAARSVDAEARDDFAIHQVAWDGTLLQTIDAAFLHHDFLELPSGELAWLSDETRDVDGEPVHGDTIMIHGLDGTTRTLWSAWDVYDYADFAPHQDFVHANALQYDEEANVLWIGLRNANQLLQLDPATGAVLKRVFGLRSDYPLSSGSKPDGQHNFSVWTDGLLIHDNQDSTDLPSRLVEYRLSEDPANVELVWEYVADEAYDVIGLGDALRLSNGDSLAIWGSTGVIDRVDADAVLTARFAANLGTAFGYGRWIDDLQPLPLAE